MKIGYYIKPRIEHKWFFFNRRIVYDIMYNTYIDEWIDESFANGLGCYMPIIRTEVVCTLNTLADAKYFKKLLCTK